MGKGDIKTKLVLEGEAEYKRQMTDAANAIKVLDSEQKLAAAQFKNTGDAQKYAADSAAILKQKIEEQQKAVNAAQAAVNKLTDDGVNPNSKAMQEWRIKLNNAKTKLIELQKKLGESEGDLKDQGQAFDDTTTDAGEYQDKLSEIEKEVRFQNTITAIDTMREALGNALSKAKEFVEWLYGAETQAGQWADNMATAAAQAAIDVETYQSWVYASLFIDTEVEKIISNREKLTKKLTSNSEEDAKAFNRISVATRDSNGDVRDATEVFWDVIDALGGISDPTLRASAAEDIFGNSWRDLQPLIEAGSEAFKNLAKEGREVAVVSEENVSKLGALDDSHNKMLSALNKTTLTLRAFVAPAFTTLNNAVSDALTRFNAWAESDEGREALEGLGNAAVGMVESITEKDFQGWVDKATEAVESFTSALNWIGDHGDLITGTLIAMGGAWAGLTVSKEVLTFAHLLSNINWDKLKGSAAGKNAVNEAAQAVSNAASGKTGAAASAAASSGGSLASVMGAAAEMYLMYKSWDWAIGRRKGDQSKLVDTQEHVQAAAEGNEELYQALADMVHAQKQMEDSFAEYANGNLSEDDYNSIIDRANALAEAFNAMEGSEKLLDAWESWRAGNAISDWVMPEDIGQKLQDAADQAQAGGEEIAEKTKEGIGKNAQEAVQAAQDMAQETVDETEQEMSFLETVGANAGQGLANGLRSKLDEVASAADALAQAVQERMAGALKIASPSKVMEQLGGYVAEGFAIGIERRISDVQRAVDSMISITSRPLGSAPSPARAAATAGGPRTVVLQIDKHTLGSVMVDEMDGQLGAVLDTRR